MIVHGGICKVATEPTMVERAARAAVAEFRRQVDGKSMNHPAGEDFAWHAESDGLTIDMGLVVRAAIATMRVPTEAMIEAGIAWAVFKERFRWESSDDAARMLTAAAIFRAMIDAALAPAAEGTPASEVNHGAT